MEMKTCTRCDQTLPLTDYYQQLDGKYGVNSVCITCKKLWDKEYKSRPEIKARTKKYHAQRYAKLRGGGKS